VHAANKFNLSTEEQWIIVGTEKILQPDFHRKTGYRNYNIPLNITLLLKHFAAVY